MGKRQWEATPTSRSRPAPPQGRESRWKPAFSYRTIGALSAPILSRRRMAVGTARGGDYPSISFCVPFLLFTGARITMHRRHFLETTLGTAAAAMTIGRHAQAAASTDDIRVAQIGFRGQGRGHLEKLGKHIVALCDVDEKVLDKQGQQYKEKGQKVELFTDFRKLLQRKDIDAVSIATPNHTHALITVLAAQAGKDVYVEKPASHNIWEGRQMVAAAQRYGRIIQCGTQSRSSPALKQAAEFVQSGGLGAIRYAVGTCYKHRPSIGKSETAFQFPSHIHRDLWIGPAADEPFYRPARNSQGGENPHYDWHWDYNTGNGDLGNQGIHQMDIARWFLGEPNLAPRTLSIGGRLGYDDAGNTANTQITLHAYEKAPLVFEVRGLPRSASSGEMDRYRGSQIGVFVQCEKGYVVIPSYSEATAFDHEGRQVKHWQQGGDHHDNWLEAIAARDPQKLNAEIEVGHRSSALCHTANVSYRLGKKLPTPEIAERIAYDELLSVAFDRMLGHLRAHGVAVDGSEPVLTMGEWLTVDPATESFVGNDAANELRTRQYRQPFEVPDIERELATQAAAAS
ncbi:MAG: dehydrogenase [Planctomycetota bacterium]|nr:MAG: dehydrogenase [Planctomycetota bacterium]